MSKSSILYLFYGIYIICGVLSLVFVPKALTYSIGSEISLIIFFLPLIYVLWNKFGFLFLLKTILILSSFACIIEYIGLTTGWPYSSFVYTGALGYKLFGVLPWTVALSWTPLMLGSVALVYRLTRSVFLRIVLPVCILVLFDFLLDPVAVHIGLWHYLHPGPYYSVPWQNFLGWSFSGFLGSLLCLYLFNSKNIFDVFELRYSFFISIIFWTSIAVLQMLIVPACVGIILIALYLVIESIYNAKNMEH